jgi:hypothetical protein
MVSASEFELSSESDFYVYAHHETHTHKKAQIPSAN